MGGASLNLIVAVVEPSAEAPAAGRGGLMPASHGPEATALLQLRIEFSPLLIVKNLTIVILRFSIAFTFCSAIFATFMRCSSVRSIL